MPWSPDSSTTGGAITGFTTPAMTITSDAAPVSNARQMTCTALTGCGTAVANSASKPMTATFYKPAVLKTLPDANPLSGQRGSIPNNQYKLVVRKGGDCAAGVSAVAIARLTIDIPAGMETYNADNVKTLVSWLVGLLNEESNDLADTLVTGVLP